jgi:fluoroacetyl-CoA thioesterase
MSQKAKIGEATARVSPVVLSTARMIELMELAAARLMKPTLRDGESSASVEMKVTHVAPAFVGGNLRAVAGYAGVSGRLHRFKINVFDESGLIGSAEHTRAVVSEQSVMEIARRRAGKTSALLMV